MIVKDKIMPDFTGQQYRFHYVTALNLLEGMGVSRGRIRIRKAGVYRNYRGEIRSQEPEPGSVLSDKSIITLEIGSNSAVDFMPFQFFYGLKGLRDSDNTWEEESRSLFAPFDSEAVRYEAAMHFYTLRYEQGIVDSEHLARFMDLFEYRARDSGFKADELLFLSSILPSVNEWGGNPDIVTDVLSRLFGYRVKLNENAPACTEIPAELQYHLGSSEAYLGSETLIGRSFKEYDSTYELVFTDLPPGDIRHLLPGGKIRARIEKFLDYCMPGDLDYRITLKVDSRAVGRETKKYLGYSSYL
ncbi:MAG: type VI secretion system baseplate subunit TssG [Candidatus Krumholzibacteriota bacterium]|nr:type VI secretion system baseplate subunit TssG [Candidatus Krumholzibacteriota bacterium]